ncbi:MAG: hypothetical protein JXL97_15825, partial [Bacteroidales bacterium]|nr:hypothetical protein [Bacteroidales bacterium]
SSSDTIVGETIENNTIDQVEENKTEEDKSFWDSLNDLFGGDKKNETESVNESEENVDELEDAVEEGIDEPSAEDELIVNETKNSTNESTQSEAELLKACESLGGKVCVVNEETCEGQIKTSKNIKCCIGECVPVKKSSTGKTIGWILIISIALFVTWFLKKKYMKARPQSPNLIDIANKK